MSVPSRPGAHPREPELARALAYLRRRSFAASFVGALGRQGALALVCVGAAGLLLRAVAGFERDELAPLFALLPLALVTSWFSARRCALSPGGARAWLDLRAGGSGLVLAALESGDERWGRSARELVRGAAPLRIASARLFAPLAPALCFFIAASWIEIERSPAGPPVVIYEASLERLEERIAALAEEIELGEEEELLRERMERLRAEIERGARLESAFEALDRFEGALAERAAEALERTRPAAESLASLGALAASESAAAGAAMALGAEAARALGAAQLGARPGERLAAALAEFGLGELAELGELAGAQLSASELRALASALGATLGESQRALASLCKSSADRLRELVEREGMCESAGHKDGESSCSGSSCEGGSGCAGGGICAGAGEGGLSLASGGGSSAGSGGISRGPGAAELGFGGEAPGRAEDFRAEALPGARGLDADSAALFDRGLAEPTADPIASGGGLATFEASSGERAFGRRIAPRHRDVVQGFFGSER